MIFGVGLSKTGTTSLYAALHELGYRSATYGHMAELGLNDWFCGNFTKDHLAEYDAVTDLPIGLFYAQLDKRYPGSKFILTVRDIDSWLASAKKQFSRRPNPPPGFNRDVRLASYGMTAFDEDRYRLVYETHVENVKRYFRDRPAQLIVMNITAGEGWEKLCPFLGRKVPRKPFPNVQPGWRPRGRPRSPKASVQPHAEFGISHGGARPFVFVLPVCNPMNREVREYAAVEAMLDQTVRSLLQQSYQNVRVVVVCHGRPRTTLTGDSRVVYLDVSRTGVFGANANSLQIDKGLRYVIGMAFAIREFGPDLIMPMDADDYVNTRLADLAISEWRWRQNIEALIIDLGVEVLIKVGPRRPITYEKAIIVDGINYECGSCRIFSAARLQARLDQISPDLLDRFAPWERTRNGAFRVPAAPTRWLYSMTFPKPRLHGPAYQLVHALGRHIRQARVFTLFPLAILGAAKSCGHGNHAGPGGGGLHEDKAIGNLSIAAFKRMFGLNSPKGLS